jgi:predicted molibdopterin-dependent oxidoreductase YjgC
MINFTLNDQPLEVPDGTTVLQAARANGITIPTLCDHPDLTPYGGCRLCVVEVEGARVPQAACTLPAANGLKVRTESPALTQSRKTVLELLLSNYYDSGYTPSKDPALDELAHWVQHYDVQLPENLKPRQPRYAVIQTETQTALVEYLEFRHVVRQRTSAHLAGTVCLQRDDPYLDTN